MIKKGYKCVLFFLISSLILVSCSPKTSEVKKVRIAHFPNVTHSQALVARSNGLIQEKLGGDIEVEFYTFNAGPAEIEAFFAGQIDLGYIGPVPAINGNIKSNGDIVILAGATNAGAMMLVSEKSTIQSISDLSGKKIAIPQIGNTQHLSLLSILSENGLSDTTGGGTVEVVPASNPDIKALLEKGDIEAAYVPEPWASRLVHEINARILLDEREVFRNGEYCTALVIGKRSFVEKNPEIVEKFLEAHLENTEFIISEREEAKAIINNQIEALTGQKIEPIVLDSVFERLQISYDPIKESVMEFMEVSHNLGFIDKLNSEEKLFSLEIMNKILKSRNLTEIK